MKFFLWPLVVWQAATRRVASAALAVVIGAALLLLSWAVVGFAGSSTTPTCCAGSRTPWASARTRSTSSGSTSVFPRAGARGLWLAAGLALLAGVVVLGRRGDEASAFLLAIAASLALTPIVWLHYFALLLVAVAVAQPRLGVVWFVPLAMVITPGSGHPSPFETAATLAIAALTVGLAVRASVREERALVAVPRRAEAA